MENYLWKITDVLNIYTAFHKVKYPKFSKETSWGWRNGSSVKNICSLPEKHNPFPAHGGSLHLKLQFQGINALSDLRGHCTHMPYKQRHTCTYVKITKVNIFKMRTEEPGKMAQRWGTLAAFAESQGWVPSAYMRYHYHCSLKGLDWPLPAMHGINKRAGKSFISTNNKH